MSTGSLTSGISGWLSEIESDVQIKRVKARNKVSSL